MRKPDILKGIERILNDVIAAERYVKISEDGIIMNAVNNNRDYLEDLFVYVGEYFGVAFIDDDLSACLTFADLAQIIQEKQHDNAKK